MKNVYDISHKLTYDILTKQGHKTSIKEDKTPALLSTKRLMETYVINIVPRKHIDDTSIPENSMSLINKNTRPAKMPYPGENVIS